MSPAVKIEKKTWGKTDFEAFYSQLPAEIDASKQYPGSCLCGGIRFNLAGDPLKKIFCYCDHCRKSTGGVGRPAENLTIDDPNGYKTVYLIPGDGTTTLYPKENHFCRNCGSTVVVMPLMMQRKLVFVTAGLMHHGLDAFTPAIEHFADKRAAFLSPIPGAESFKTRLGENVALDDDSRGV
ncbi:hypothetical protein CSOJ01_12851 [Colletotrichum sojae]|uniref:CENP-V/GFA domain-containing protein n=1 Tax=Colletotrichum sojae TaxID=2175907 RepID=A0A8H6IUN7_9PEZI|nr:hypothetical protein CSOJ01_12851 [Colletotrichum sojae]